MGNLTRITMFKHFSGLTITASKSLPNSTAGPLCINYKKVKHETKNINGIILCIYFNIHTWTKDIEY